MLTKLIDSVDVPANLVIAEIAIALILAVGSLVRWIALRGASPQERRERLGSLAVWWVMLTVISLTLPAGRVGGAITFGSVSLVALWEYFRMLDKKSIDRIGRSAVVLSVPAVYGCVATATGDVWPMLIVFAVTIGVSILLVLAGRTKGYIASAGSLVWGAVVLVLGVAHAPLLLTLPSSSNPDAGTGGWLLYLIVFTQCDDICQALWGRRFGRHKMTPVVSPHKTYEGFLLGGLSTIVVGVILSPFLTPLGNPWKVAFGGWTFSVPFLGAVLSGILLWLAGFFGDLNMSAVKRDVGVKDAGNWLPGQGGILDRIDSLTFTAPVFYYFIRLCYS